MGTNRRAKKGRFVGIPYHVASSHQFTSLSAHGCKLAFDLSYQYTGSNNGSLSACWTLMRKRGWKSSSTVHKALRELLEKGFVIKTKLGRKQRGHPTLLALTWHGINEPQNQSVEYEDGVTSSNTPLSYWCKAPQPWKFVFFSSLWEWLWAYPVSQRMAMVKISVYPFSMRVLTRGLNCFTHSHRESLI